MRNIWWAVLSLAALVSAAKRADIRGPVTCEGGQPAELSGNSYCCIAATMKYCCNKDDPLICFTEKMAGAPAPVEEKSSEEKPDSDEKCSQIKIHRVAISALRLVGADVPFLKLVTLTLGQYEGCDVKDRQMSVRWIGIEPGREYSIMFGDNIACGSTRDNAEEVARIHVSARSGNVHVPSHVRNLSDSNKQIISLVHMPTDGSDRPVTYACGKLNVIG